MRAEEMTTQEDQELKDRARREHAREQYRALMLGRLLDRILRADGWAKVYGRMADGSIAVEHWPPGDQMPYWRWRLTLDGEVIDDNSFLD